MWWWMRTLLREPSLRHDALLSLGWAGLAGQRNGLTPQCDNAMLYYKMAADAAALAIGTAGGTMAMEQIRLSEVETKGEKRFDRRVTPAELELLEQQAAQGSATAAVEVAKFKYHGARCAAGCLLWVC